MPAAFPVHGLQGMMWNGADGSYDIQSWDLCLKSNFNMGKSIFRIIDFATGLHLLGWGVVSLKKFKGLGA